MEPGPVPEFGPKLEPALLTPFAVAALLLILVVVVKLPETTVVAAPTTLVVPLTLVVVAVISIDHMPPLAAGSLGKFAMPDEETEFPWAD